MKVEFQLLGPLEVLRDGERVALRAAKVRTLLGALLVHRGSVASVDRLVEDLWQESPPSGARHALEAQVSRLRTALGDPAAVVAQPPGYILDVDADSIDTARFEALLADAREAQAADPERASARAAEALALWPPPPLADFTYEPFAQAEIARLEALRWTAVELRIDAELALGRGGLVPELEALVVAEPVRERLRAQLMLALYREGRQADALAAYRDARTALVEELGIEPGPELRELEAAILRQDEALSRPVRGPSAPQRKLATILFADLADSSGLAVALDPEALRALLKRYFDAASAAVVRHGGVVEKFVGDAVMAVFGSPLAHEDDALRAARAAVELRDAVARLDEDADRDFGVRLQVRIGLATGEVLASGSAGDPLATGPAVIVASRLQQEVRPGEIAVDELTQRLTAGAGSFATLGGIELRGLRGPVQAFRLEELSPDTPALARRLDARLVGRVDELAALREALDAAVRERALKTVAVLGPPGIGKSRLTRELVDAVAADATVLRGRCDAYGEGTTLRPLREALGSPEAVAAVLAGEPEAEAIAARLEAIFRTDTAVPVGEVPWAFRRYCETRAARTPVVLVLDDLHWAEPPLLDLVEYLATSAQDAPILLVCIAREELVEERPAFPGVGAALVLEPLSDDETNALAAQLLPESALDAATHDQLVAAAEGNPLFLEQLVAHVAETGLLEPPPTLRALLAARLDRLGPGERGVLERAAVVGRDFTVGDVTELLDVSAAPTVPAHLDVLARRGFIRHVGGGAFRFRHWLIHDAAYRAAPKQLRAELHEQYADVLARRDADDELIGYHLEHAYLLSTELAPEDRHAKRLAEDAGRRLGAAGIRAWKRGEALGASGLLSRSASLLPPEDEERRELLCELGIALNTAGETERADVTLREATEIAARTGDRRIELRAQIELAAAHLLDEQGGSAQQLFDLADSAIPVFESLGDNRSVGRTWMLTGWVQGGMYCHNTVWEESAERALRHYREAAFPTATCVGHIAAALYFGPTQAADGVVRCTQLLEREVEDRSGEANVLAHLAGLQAMLGNFDDARELSAAARQIYVDLGQPTALVRTCAPLEAAAERLSGDAERAIAILVDSCNELRDMRNWSSLSTQAAELADALVAVGRIVDAQTWVDVAAANASDGDASAQFSWRSTGARILAQSQDLEQAEHLARDALRIADGTDALNQRAGVRLALADVLAGAARQSEAAAVTADAVRLLEEKGNAAAVARLRTEQRAAALP
jgi:class 3 adenylate cyclase/DNA-binding winged helix-turn-helix (wHTH) protein